MPRMRPEKVATGSWIPFRAFATLSLVRQSLSDQIVKQRLVIIAFQKTRQFAAQPFTKLRAKTRIFRGFGVMQDERADQDLAAHVVVALGFRETGLEGGPLRLQFR